MIMPITAATVTASQAGGITLSSRHDDDGVGNQGQRRHGGEMHAGDRQAHHVGAVQGGAPATAFGEDPQRQGTEHHANHDRGHDIDQVPVEA